MVIVNKGRGVFARSRGSIDNSVLGDASRTRKSLGLRSTSRLVLLVLLVFGVLSFDIFDGRLQSIAPTIGRAATTFVVTNNNDTGPGSLHQAILDANANPGIDSITFNIGFGLQTITPLSFLPDISDPVVIDGTTQPGFAGSPLIELSAINSQSLPNRGVLFITAGNTTVRGLVINHFRDEGISIVTAGGNHIEGNYIGTDATGTAGTNCNGTGISINNSPNNVIGGMTPLSGNLISGNRTSNGIAVFGSNGMGNQIQGNLIGTNAAGTAALGNHAGIFLGSSNNTVGGTVPEARNVIAASDYAGIVLQISGTSGNVIQGNYIGTTASGNEALANANFGIAIFYSSNNIIGGPEAGAGNVVSGNGWGISIANSGSGNVIQGNLIGVGADGFSPLGNRVEGVRLADALNTTVGGDLPGSGNVIAFNGPTMEIGIGFGVEVLGGEGNSIRRNSIFSNGRLGIDLDANGLTPNDPGDGDSGGNNRQNFPLITSVVSDGSQTTVLGTLNSTPNTTFALDFYSNAACDPSGNGEGAKPFGLNSTAISTDAKGNASFGLALSIPLPLARALTATATDPSGNTSEFSPCDASKTGGAVQFSSASYKVNEDAGFIPIKVNRLGGSTGQLTVNYSTVPGTATAGQDYTSTSGTLTFDDGENSQTFNLPINDDGLIEPEEFLTLLLRNPGNPESLGAPITAVLTIQNRGSIPVLTLDSVSVDEGDNGTTNAVFTVSLPANGRTVTVNYSSSALTATAGVDFQNVSGSLTFSPRVMTQTINVPVIGDTLDESDEGFRLNLSSPVNANVSYAGFGTIVDDDPLPTVSISDASVTEGHSGSTIATFTVTLSAPSAKVVSAAYTTLNGTASSSSDFVWKNDGVTFNPGELVKTGTVTINGDLSSELDETFLVNLNGANEATVARRQGTITILNDDGTCALTLSHVNQSIGSSGEPGSVGLTASYPDCEWTTTSNSSFIKITSGASRVGSGTVNYLVGANPTLDARSGTISIGGQTFTVHQIAPTWASAVLSSSQAEIKTWTFQGRTFAYAKLSFPNGGYRVTDWGQPASGGNNFSANATIERFTGAAVQAVTTTAQVYDLGPLVDGNYSFTFANSSVVVDSHAFTVNSAVQPPNPIDSAREFVRQQYRDFLNREADQAGEDFWTDNIAKCSDPARRPVEQTEAQCRLRQQETTSAAFFLSPEFQYTGYFVYRMYLGALRRPPKLSEFTADVKLVGKDIIVNGQLSAAQINKNKFDYALEFANCSYDTTPYRCGEFKDLYDWMPHAQYIDQLFLNTGINPSAAERQALVFSLQGANETRATVLQKVVDGVKVLGEGDQQFTTSYGKAFYDQQFTRAFVQLEYFGYMKRDPDEPGFAFWLDKLNSFGGDFVNSEMVLAFISSPEYRARFGQP